MNEFPVSSESALLDLLQRLTEAKSLDEVNVAAGMALNELLGLDQEEAA